MNNRIKLLFITTEYVGKNGVTNVIFNLLDQIKDIMDVDLLSNKEPEPEYLEKLSSANAKNYIVKRDKMHIATYVYNVSKIVKKNHYDIVHVHGNSYSMALEMIAAAIGGCHVRIAHSHNTTCKYKTVNKIFEPFFFKFYTDGLACGMDSGAYLYKGKPFEVIKNGINTDSYKFNKTVRDVTRKELGIDNCIVMGNVGSLNDFKNQEFIIEILKQINEKEKYKVLLIGDGPRRQVIEQKVKSYGLTNNVIFLGATSDVPKYLNACDIIVMPSFHEGLPLSLIEEQANGLRCICSNSITREVDKTGLIQFVSLDDPINYWIDAIESIPIIDDRSNISDDAINKIKQSGYAIEDEAKKLVGLYECMVEKRNIWESKND